MKSITFEGIPSGDCECFCWDVTEEEYRKFFGEEQYQHKKKFNKEEEKDYNEHGIEYEPESWRIYPNDLIKSKKKMKFTLIIEETK